MRLKSAIQKCRELGNTCVGVYGKDCTSTNISKPEEYKLCKSGIVSTCSLTNNCKLGQKILAQGRHYEILHFI